MIISKALDFLSFLLLFYTLLLSGLVSLLKEAPRSKVPEGSCTKDSLSVEFEVFS